MKKIIFVLLVATILSGCGAVEKIYDRQNYESITNETGTLKLISGGIVTFEYKHAKIIYSNSDSQSIFFAVDGDEKYYQGDLLFDID